MIDLKIGIICFWDRAATPYLEKYERILESKEIDYNVIFWNRTGMISSRLGSQEKEIIFRCRTNTICKILDFFSWKNRIIKFLKKEKFDFLIVLSTYPAVLLSNYLFKNYREKYIFDIRDYSMEANPLFGKIVTRLVEKSAFTTISSKGYMRWLKESSKIILNHNITYYEENYEKNIKLKSSDKLNFTFVGNVRLDKQTKAVLLNLKNSNRFVSGFVGRILPTCDILELCCDNNIKNVYFGGVFTNKDKPDIYRNIDLINAIYANNDKKIRLADSTPLPNRVYDAAVFKCPIIASKGTYLAELIDEYNFGFSVNGFDNDIEKQFDIFIETFDEKIFREGCERFLKIVLEEEKTFMNKIYMVIENFEKGRQYDNKF